MQKTSLYACRAHLSLGNYGEAIRACETASAHGLDWWYLQLLLSGVCPERGRGQVAGGESALVRAAA